MKKTIYEEQKELVLARFKILNPSSKIILGGNQELTVNDIIKHVEDGDDLGINIVKVQMRMLKILASEV